MTDADKPTAREIPVGWHLVKSGKVVLGDKYWTWRVRVFLPVVDRTTFLGEFIGPKNPKLIIIRKGGK